MWKTTFQLDGVIRGHHVYKFVWTPIIGETLLLTPDEGNIHDIYAVGMDKNAATLYMLAMHLENCLK